MGNKFARSSRSRYPRPAQQVVRTKMHDFQQGRLKNRAGNPVERNAQALNIARHEARLAGATNVPPPEGRGAKKKAEGRTEAERQMNREQKRVTRPPKAA